MNEKREVAIGIGVPTLEDGTPLGSATNAECRIDSIAQSWGLSLLPLKRLEEHAMAAVEDSLAASRRWLYPPLHSAI